MARYLVPRLRDFLFVLLLVGGLLSGSRMLNTDSDLGRHLTLGNYILSHHQIPTRDILSYTKAGETRPPYEWLAEVAFALAYRLLSLDGAVLLSALLIAAAFTLVYLDCVHRSAAPIIALFITLGAAAASSLNWVSRPHLFSFIFLGIWLAMLDRTRRRERQPLWQFPLLMLVWANTHGEFLFGFLTYGAYLAGWLLDAWRHRLGWPLGRRLVAIGAMSLVASIITPDLWGNWVATLNNRSSFVLGHTVETMPLNLGLFNSWPFLALLALSVGLMALLREQVAPTHVLLLLGLAVSSFAMARNVPLFAIAAAPLCTQWLMQAISGSRVWAKIEEALSRIDRGLHGFLWSVVAVAVATIFFFFQLSQTGTTVFQWNPGAFPVSAAAWLERNPPSGPMFNDINWGGYLLFRLWPAQRVFIDSQTDFYGEPFTRQYVDILSGSPDWQSELDQFGVGWLLIPPSTALAMEASKAPGWRVAYEDSTAIVLVRR